MPRSLDLQVRGQAGLRRAAAQLRAEAKRLPPELRREALKALNVIPPMVRAETAILPSGYRGVLRPSLRFNKSVRLVRAGGVSMNVSAVGRRQQRDVAALDRGVLRHPLWGNRQHWYTTTVPRGLVAIPFQRAEPHIVDRLARVRDMMRDRLAHG